MAWIVAWKVLKVALTVSGGVLALSLRHRDLVDIIRRWILHFGLDPGGPISSHVLARVASGVDSERLHWVAAGLFFYATMYVVEAAGLYFEKRWAEWFTVFQTSLIIPLEIYGLYRRPEIFKWLMLIMSVTTVAYLLWRLRHDRMLDLQEEAAAHPAPRADPRADG